MLQKLLGPEVSISSIQISRCAEKLDAGLEAWRNCPLDETTYVLLDARYERVREAGQAGPVRGIYRRKVTLSKILLGRLWPLDDPASFPSKSVNLFGRIEVARVAGVVHLPSEGFIRVSSNPLPQAGTGRSK